MREGVPRGDGKRRVRQASRLDEAMLYATTPHMFAAGAEAAAFGRLRGAVKRPLYGCDCYAYALVASGFGPHLVCEARREMQPRSEEGEGGGE